MRSLLVLVALAFPAFSSPLPRVEADVDEAALAGYWEFDWGPNVHQHANFGDYYDSPEYGGGFYFVGKGGRVEFAERSNHYVMELRRQGAELVGTGWSLSDDGTRSQYSVPVRLKRKAVD